MRPYTILCALLFNLFHAPLWADDGIVERRQEMIKEISETVRYTQDYLKKSELSPEVIAVMGKVQRHEFVPGRLQEYAYENRPLPIGESQTISQPYIVALMTDLADVGEDSIVLEVGTGSGYQAAILAEIVRHVYTIEIIEKLGKRAEQTLVRLGYDNVTVKIGDGYKGWPRHAPYDAILVTAAPEVIPPELIKQLKPGGKLVIPVGKQRKTQLLKIVEKDSTGKLKETNILPVMFVPLTGEH